MKLSELFNEALKENNVWKKLESILKDGNQLNEVSNARMSLYLQEANKVIFDKFKIDPKDKVYFIAGSARLYLFPELVYHMHELDPNFPTNIGDLDVVIPNTKIWENAGLGEFLKNGIYRPYALTPPLTDLNVEAFTVWDPSKAGGAYANVEVRSQAAIIESSEFEFGYWFMGLEDVLDYKGQMVRQKEVAVANLINSYEKGGGTPEKRIEFLKRVAMELTGKFKNN